MDIEKIKKIVDDKLLNDIDCIVEYEEIGIYQGLEGCIKYIQQLTGCDENMAIQIIEEHEELMPSNESPREYEKRVIVANQAANELLNKPQCPICKSTNLSKISTIKKVSKIGLFGIYGAGDVGKTYKCNNCGSRF